MLADMFHSKDVEEVVDEIVGGRAPSILKTEHRARDGEDPEITSWTTDGTNDRLVRLKNDYGVC